MLYSGGLSWGEVPDIRRPCYSLQSHTPTNKMKFLKNLFAKVWQKILLALKWNPVTWVNSFNEIRLKTFASFYKTVLVDILPHIYSLIALLSVVVLVFYLSLDLGFADHGIEDSDHLNSDLHIILFCGTNVIFHLSLLAAIKIRCLQDYYWKIVGVLHLISFCLLHMTLRVFINFITISNLFSSVGVASAVFEFCVITVYYQNSFIMSLILWLVCAALVINNSLLSISPFVAPDTLVEVVS